VFSQHAARTIAHGARQRVASDRLRESVKDR